VFDPAALPGIRRVTAEASATTGSSQAWASKTIRNFPSFSFLFPYIFNSFF